MTISTWPELRARNAAAGQHWFSANTMQWFSCHLEGSPYGGDVFVTSETAGPNEPRLYSVRRMHSDGTVETVGAYQEYDTLEDARRAARLIAHDLLTVPIPTGGTP